MSDAVDQKAVELMDKAATAVEAFAAKLDTLAQEYGPEVVDAALMVARADAATLTFVAALLATAMPPTGPEMKPFGIARLKAETCAAPNHSIG